MIKCSNCGKEYSDAVLPLHKQRCTVQAEQPTPEPEAHNIDTLRAKAKELGIKNYHSMGFEKLIKAIEKQS